MPDRDLAFQFSGPYVQTLMAAIQAEIDRRLPIIEYFDSLSIDTAEGDELETIGGIIGFPWPNAPTGIFDDNVFTFVTYTDPLEVNPLIGFSGVDVSTGGLFTSATPAIGNKIPIEFYRLLLTQVAYLKAHGLTFKAIDQVCHVFGEEYTINSFAMSSFILGADADFPEYDSEHGLSGVDAPYDEEGGLLGPFSGVNSDISIVFQTQIGAGFLWLIQQVFDRFTTAPQIFVSQGE